jgi:hypothetical protein
VKSYVTFFRSWAAKTLSTAELTLEELAERIQRADASAKDKLPWLKLARFGDKRTNKNSLRHDDNVISISGIEADYDGKKISIAEAEKIIRRARVRTLLYTSPSYTVAEPKWRLLLPTSDELLPGEHARLVARVNGLFGGIFASESFTLSQSYYYGSVNGNPDHVAKVFDGACINLRDDLDDGAIYPPGGTTSGGPNEPFTGKPECSKEELAEIMAFIPNPYPSPEDPDSGWVNWTNMGLRICKASGGAEWGFVIFDGWSAKAKHLYDPAPTEQRWNEIVHRSPPTRTGIGKLRKIACEYGWKPKLYPCAASYADEGDEISEAARQKIWTLGWEFLDNMIEPKLSPWIEYAYELHDNWEWRHTEAVRFKIHLDWLKQQKEKEQNRQGMPLLQWEWEHYWSKVLDEPYVPPPPVHAMKIVTGGGKTRIMIEVIAAWLKEHGRKFTPIIYAVPTHDLGEEVKKQFNALGIDARLFRGFLAFDPNDPRNIKKLRRDPHVVKKELIKMCWKEELAVLAMKTMAPIAETICKKGKGKKAKKCQHYDGEWMCPFRRQIPVDGHPDVWIVASDMLFFKHKIFEKAKCVVIDETFFQKSLRNIEGDNEFDTKWSIPLARLVWPHDEVRNFDDEQKRLDCSRDSLAWTLQQQKHDGPLEQEYLDDIDTRECKRLIDTEWSEDKRKREALGLYPGIPQRQLANIINNKKDIVDDIRLARHLITILEEIKWMLHHPEVEASGRLRLQKIDGLRCITWRGIEEIHAPHCHLPTLLLDAVLPSHKILEIFHPSVAVVADINARASPYVDIQQILNAPTTSIKLDSEEHLIEVRRYILQEWLTAGRKETLVICQKKVHEWLSKKGVPDNVHIEHYYDIAGKDIYRHVTLGILVGRPAPGPRAMEEIAGALTGEWQEPVPPNLKGFAWYPKVERGIRISGSDDGIRTSGDRHPEELTEWVRWAYNEAELINAHGRLRAINRTAEHPCQIKWLFNECLPISVNAVIPWEEPSRLAEVLAFNGLVATDVDTLRRLYPERYRTRKAARWALEKGVLIPPGFLTLEFQTIRTRQRGGRVRVAHYDPAMTAG